MSAHHAISLLHVVAVMATYCFIRRPRPSPQPSLRGRGSDDLALRLGQAPSGVAARALSRRSQTHPFQALVLAPIPSGERLGEGLR